MIKKYWLLLFALLTLQTAAEAQVIVTGRNGRGRFYGRTKQQRWHAARKPLTAFKPTVSLSAGYGFPNLDKYELPEFYNYYKGKISQNGPVTAALDYRFSRRASFGLLVTHGRVALPYYDYTNSAMPAVTGSSSNWSGMLNFMRYLPGSKKIQPYLRTALGINIWAEDFKDAAGNKVNLSSNAGDFAWQAGLGAKFIMGKNAGFFAEAGYGKYIIQGGLSFTF
jgi:hypothetical protein